MKYALLIIVLCLGIQTSAISQRGHEGSKGKIEHLKSELGLSEAQAEELKTVFEGLRENTEATSREDKRAAMDSAIAQILNEEQLAKFQELKTKKGAKGKRGNNGKKGRKAKRDLAKDEETLNRLREMRKELDESISEEDKILIEELRLTFAKHKENVKGSRKDYKQLSDDEKQALKVERKAKHEEAKVDMKELKAIAEKYETEIASIFEDNEDFFKEKKAEQKEEWKAKKKEWKEKRQERKEELKIDGEKEGGVPDGKHDKRWKGKKRGRHFSKQTRFLLMDPNGVQEDVNEVIGDFNTISVSPNPASVMTNVTYEVKTAGQIRVEIRDETGRVYEVITNEALEAGTYTKSIETSKYQDKTYYLSIIDGKSIKTEKLVIQK